ncbi:MAG: hypothetical protein JGK24_25060 [Microcoleus sp. PH2017_29_MFU_D_A]|uniref:hypothetical protein n=1 Tax=unclassified Microcoleus TaxID=2642155 RepID=UPI001E178E96|nr:MULTISPECIES: hypothetical protein [unclassified Microcoleus]TAE08205.1 MAG: hypothetical protein EAZ94_26085 [Oscillatoriales cyanobacterium]MCC3427895.1 hypothetical protein [Microcoleus sp. PH2017_01_SCD_O_A]MCC3439881.1 hypothetical protein [Microcoleus sp. PH2017_05_CCC_O_A]MCC3450724.1 hypothetical protein [Microcoleus sp. PH2017_09_SFU_O_A]MCC3456637.1 hypothetical protein [Microcoleus sp. PH2017_08_TRC_O_A]
MNKKLGILAIAALFTISGAILKGTQMANAKLVAPTTVTNQNFTDNKLTILAQGYGQPQGSPWEQVDAQKYKNPDTGQTFCFYYNPGRWAPCPNQGTSVIRVRNAKCTGSNITQALADRCPRALCGLAELQASLDELRSNGRSIPALPCNGLP